MNRALASSSTIWLLVLLFLLGGAAPAEAAGSLRVGSKRFTESYILAEIVIAAARKEGITAVHEQGLGGTAVTYRALEDGSIDLYPEYTGTISETIVHATGRAELARLREALAPKGIAISDSLGFQNTYAMALSSDAGARSGARTLSDLAEHPELRLALSHEFAGRADGWPGLTAHYQLKRADMASAIDHALAYEALAKGTIDGTDVYTTDAKIARYHLVVLADDRGFFPPYDAVLLYRADAVARFPRLAAVLERLRGAIDAPTMQKLNARAELDGAAFPRVAAEYLRATGAGGDADAGAEGSARDGERSFVRGLGQAVVRHGPRHLELVLGSLLLSTLVGVPLGVFAYVRRRSGALVLGITGIIQTIPSLALFCFFIPLLGIGPVPALAALFLYGLLPIVRNTHAGLSSIPTELRDAALALGLSAGERLRYVELPLASRTILAGIKTSAVVAVGSATIAAFIGAGGFGEPISTGLSLNDVPMILEGALPAAGLALLVQGAFGGIERWLVPAALSQV
jgi:osmoprotectant transport system permease protein